MTPENETHSLTQTIMRCLLLRSQPAEPVAGFITAWGARSLTVLVAPRAGLRLNEPLVVQIGSSSGASSDDSAPRACLHSSVVSIVWQNAGDLMGLDVRVVKTLVPSNSGYPSRDRTRLGTVS